MSSHSKCVIAQIAFIISLLLSFSSIGQKFKMNSIYYDVDDAFSGAEFMSINSDDPLQANYGIINLETVETVGRYIYKTKSEEVDFQDSALPFFLKDMRNGQLRIAWTTKQIEKEKYRKLQKVEIPKVEPSPNYIHPKVDHARLFLIFRASSTVRLNNKESIEPVVKNGIFKPQIFELKIYEEGQLDMTINQSSNKKSINLFFGDEYYILVDYRNTTSYLDIYPRYLGELMMASLEPSPVKVKPLNLKASDQHKIVNEIRKLDSVNKYLKDSAKSFNSKYALDDPNWVYLGNQGKDGKAHGIGDAVSRDGQRFVLSGYFKEGTLKSGVMETIFGEKMVGNFKDYALVDSGYHVLREGTIFSGKFVNGLLQGQGTMMNTAGIQYEGEFKDFLIHGSGKITVPNGDFYEGRFENGLPNGTGTFDTNSKIEQCDYFRGVRSDQNFMTVTENKRNEHFRKMSALDSKKKLKYLNTYSRRRTANQLFKQMAHINGTSIVHQKLGMDAQKTLSALPRNFPGVISNVTDDLLRINNQWVNDQGFTYRENQALYLNLPLQKRPKQYREAYVQMQVFLEGIQKKNAELNEQGGEIKEEIQTEPDNSEDDWSWDEPEPIAKVPVAKDVWIPGYFSCKEAGCSIWKWSDYSVELRVCKDGGSSVSIANKDYDPVKLSYKIQFKTGISSPTWQADLLPEDATKEPCPMCDTKKSGVRAVYLKDFELQVD